MSLKDATLEELVSELGNRLSSFVLCGVRKEKEDFDDGILRHWQGDPHFCMGLLADAEAVIFEYSVTRRLTPVAGKWIRAG